MRSLHAAIALFVLGLILGPASAQEKRPNILFIFTDDHSYRNVSCYPEAYSFSKTPNMDRLAKNGIRFSHAYMGTWCTPSRATMLTGKYPHGVESLRHVGKYPGSEYDPAQLRFWPSVFRARGYFTGQIGKWHTGKDTGFGRDWDFQIVWNRPKFPENSTAYYKDQMISKNGGEDVLTPGYPTDNYTKWAVDFINGKERDQSKPWFLWLCHGAPHGPYTPHKRHLDEIPGVKVPIPSDIYPPRAGKPDYVDTMEVWVKGKDGQPVLKDKGEGKKDLHEWVRQYQQCTMALDEGIGAVLKALEDSGQLDNTLIIFTADQGFAWGQHGFRHKLAPYDANIRSPFIISMPSRLPKGVVCNVPVSGTDVAPTIFGFVGEKLPWAMHGHDLTPILKDPTKAPPRQVLTEFTGDQFGSNTLKIPSKENRYHDIPWWVSLMDGRWKYIRTLEEGEVEELYDLQGDPDELTNLALNPVHAERVAKMRGDTVAELRRTGAGYVDRLPTVRALKK